ncbi:hypothetical protein WH95_19610 [Kiloniella litopenaei]|uniref:Chromosome partitioning protein ParA n=1 Tax=Kiloniella litopenaei TaxID=1549748 RepID=A0A0M2R028_9PROT|nr:ParA family protein [Kiloniella litopenaei]KKJ75232.1 hypothetical protein WH95_19610 [Kiloniella litopenaei]
MPTIVLASSKGGVGKTTIALVLAQALVQAGAKVSLIDADPNSPISMWEKRTGKENIPKMLSLELGVTEDNIVEKIDEAAEKNVFVIVDLEGSANLSVSYAIGRADLVLIPTQGSQLDADEAAKVLKLINREAKAYRRTIPFAVALSKTPYIKPRTAKHIESDFKKSNIPILPVEMFERDAFRAIFTFGGTLYDLTQEEVSSPQKAIENAEHFAKGVANYIREQMNG